MEGRRGDVICGRRCVEVMCASMYYRKADVRWCGGDK